MHIQSNVHQPLRLHYCYNGNIKSDFECLNMVSQHSYHDAFIPFKVNFQKIHPGPWKFSLWFFYGNFQDIANTYVSVTEDDGSLLRMMLQITLLLLYSQNGKHIQTFNQKGDICNCWSIVQMETLNIR